MNKEHTVQAAGPALTLDKLRSVIEQMKAFDLQPPAPETVYPDYNNLFDVRSHMVIVDDMQMIELPPHAQGRYVQVRFPRSRKKRIQKKWAKNPNNFAWQDYNNVFYINGKLAASPKVLRMLRQARDNR